VSKDSTSQDHLAQQEINVERKTGSSNVTHHLTSAAYHALQGAEINPVHARDAKESGDK
jgi:hypothetical protein